MEQDSNQKNLVEVGKEHRGVPGAGSKATVKLDAALSGRELDAAVAERVMGWRWWATKLRYSEDVRKALHHPEFKNDEWWLADSSEEMFGDGPANPFMPHYSENIAAAMEVENRILDLKLEVPYAEALWLEVNQQDAANNRYAWWRIMHASAEQRCRAALQACASASALSTNDESPSQASDTE